MRNCKEYRSNQHEIWDEIKDLENKAGAESETGAMKDSYQHKENDLEAYLGHFKHYPGQRGIVVMINGKTAGLDYISHAKAFSELHDILVRSYAMNAVLNPPNSLIKPGHFKKSAIKGFIKMAGQCASRRYESVGKGHDIRFTGETCTGSALVVDYHVIHASFFNGCNEL